MSNETNLQINFKHNTDTLSMGDFLYSYLNESTVQCFENCVKDFSTSQLKENEINCMNSCYSKHFLSFSNVAESMNLSLSNLKEN